MLLKDKVIIVTGAASGIGLASSVMLAEAGARVILNGRHKDHLDEAHDRIVSAGGVALTAPGDVSDEEDAAELVAMALREYGRLDGAFNNAGVPMNNKPTWELTAQEWDSVQSVNIRAAFLCVKHQMRAMKDLGGGAIVINSSIDSEIAVPGWTEYTTSKHAVNGLVRGAAAEAKTTGVRVNAVLPGYIITPMSQPLFDNPDEKKHIADALERHSVGRFGKPEDVGYAVRWLLSDEAAFVNGALLPVDGGYLAR